MRRVWRTGRRGGKLSIKEIRQVNPGHFPTGGQISEISASWGWVPGEGGGWWAIGQMFPPGDKLILFTPSNHGRGNYGLSDNNGWHPFNTALPGLIHWMRWCVAAVVVNYDTNSPKNQIRSNILLKCYTSKKWMKIKSKNTNRK